MKLPILHSTNYFSQVQNILGSLQHTSNFGIGLEQIIFKKGWDNEENNNVGNYSQDQIIAILRASKEYPSLGEMIDSGAKCKLTITKGCHQENDPHITANGAGSTDKCGNVLAGSKSLHIPCS